MSREKKFTPGPWEASAESLRVEKGHSTLACVTVSLKVSAYEAVANANLIAAASELLKELESHCRGCMSRNKWSSCSGCYTHRAIKKAYGETE